MKVWRWRFWKRWEFKKISSKKSGNKLSWRSKSCLVGMMGKNQPLETKSIKMDFDFSSPLTFVVEWEIKRIELMKITPNRDEAREIDEGSDVVVDWLPWEEDGKVREEVSTEGHYQQKDETNKRWSHFLDTHRKPELERHVAIREGTKESWSSNQPSEANIDEEAIAISLWLTRKSEREKEMLTVCMMILAKRAQVELSRNHR